MKTNRLLHTIGQIDDAYVTEAVRYRPRKILWLRVCAVAACVALLVGGGTLYQRYAYPDLPMLDFSETDESGQGYEAYLAPSFDHLKINNPWTPDTKLTTLPVYDNSAIAACHNAFDEPAPPAAETIRAMQQELLRVAACLGINADESDIREDSYSRFGYKIEDASYQITIDDTRLLIEFKRKDALPDGYSLGYHDDYEDLSRTAEYLLDTYGDLINMETPGIDISLGDYTIYGEPLWHINFYDRADDPTEALLNYCFGQVRFSGDDDGNLWLISFSRYDLSTVIGNYPIITPEKAQSLLEEGYYVSSTTETFPGSDAIQKVELTYRNTIWDTVFVPYYRFYVEEATSNVPGLKSYATYYVPAVDSRYIESLKQWDGSING